VDGRTIANINHSTRIDMPRGYDRWHSNRHSENLTAMNQIKSSYFAPQRFLPLQQDRPASLSPRESTIENLQKVPANIPSWHLDRGHSLAVSREATASPPRFDHSKSRDVSQESASLENFRRNQNLQYR